LHAAVRVDASRLNALTGSIIGAAIEVHRELGPGLLEQAYEACFCFELLSRGHSVERQVPLPVTFKGQRLDCGYRIDLFVERAVVVEVKAIEALERVHLAQLMSYLKFARCPVGLLFNFNVAWLKAKGIKRVVNDVPE
jgi:GxxExxY protein